MGSRISFLFYGVVVIVAVGFCCSDSLPERAGVFIMFCVLLQFDSRLLAHFKSHHERHLLQYQSSQDVDSPSTTMANIRTVSPLPTMAVQEAVQIADAQAANHDGSSLPRPPKLVKMETPDGERAVAVHIQQGGYLNRPDITSGEEADEASAAMESDMAPHGYAVLIIAFPFVIMSSSLVCRLLSLINFSPTVVSCVWLCFVHNCGILQRLAAFFLWEPNVLCLLCWPDIPW